MRRIAVEKLKSGMVVARTIYDANARALLQAGIILEDAYIKRLNELGIRSIYVKDPILFDIDIPEAISETTRLKTIKEIKTNFVNIENNLKLNIRSVKSLVDNILDELLASHDTLIHLTDLRTYDDYTFGHSVNVAILSIMTGISLGYHDFKLKELGLGAILHDIGKTKIDKYILNKPDDLTSEEYEEIKNHPAYGFAILRNYDDMPLLSAHIAYQHHERWDGQGYPRNLEGEEIHEYARIVAVADVYDALIADRPYRPAYTVNQALTVLKRMSNTYLDQEMVNALISNIAVYPIGSIVELNTGDIAIVVDVNRNAPTRPVLNVIYHKTTQKLCSPHEIDLSKLTTIIIKKSLTPEDLDLIIKN